MRRCLFKPTDSKLLRPAADKDVDQLDLSSAVDGDTKQYSHLGFSYSEAALLPPSETSGCSIIERSHSLKGAQDNDVSNKVTSVTCCVMDHCGLPLLALDIAEVCTAQRALCAKLRGEEMGLRVDSVADCLPSMHGRAHYTPSDPKT